MGDFMDERKRAAKEARLQNRGQSNAYVADKGEWRQWRQKGGGVTMLIPDTPPQDNDSFNQSAIQQIEQLYRAALAKRERKAVEGSRKAVEQFERQIKMVAKQIEAQKAREARHRRKIRPKPENKFGVLISGDIIEKVTVSALPNTFSDDVSMMSTSKKASEDWSRQMGSIVTVKIERGESVQVLSKNINATRTESGPQVLILSTTEQIVGSTFTLNSNNSSFKPEFNWQISTSLSLSPSTFSHSNLYSPSFSFGDDYYSSSSSSSRPYSFADEGLSSSSSSHSYSYSFADDSLSSSTNSCYSSFSFDSPSTSSHSFGIPFSEDTMNGHSFVSDVSQFGFTQPNEKKSSPAKEKSLEQRLRELLERREEINKIRSVYNEGFTTASDYKNRMAELSFGLWEEGNDQFEDTLNADIEIIQQEIAEKANAGRGTQHASEQKGKESPAAARSERGRGGAAKPRGTPAINSNRGRGSARARGGPIMPSARGRGMDRGRGRGGFAGRGARGGFAGRGARGGRGGRGGNRGGYPMGSDGWSDVSAADFGDAESVISYH